MTPQEIKAFPACTEIDHPGQPVNLGRCRDQCVARRARSGGMQCRRPLRDCEIDGQDSIGESDENPFGEPRTQSVSLLRIVSSILATPISSSRKVATLRNSVSAASDRAQF